MVYTDLSIDLETLGTDPGSVITQIGLCAFDARGHVTSTIQKMVRLDPQSCLDAGMKVSWSTIHWWLQQSQEARNCMTVVGGLPLVTGLWTVRDFIRDNLCVKFDVWGNGATFDVTLLEDAYRRVRVPVPWNFRGVRDLRTLASLSPCQLVARPSPVVEHNAMDDAVAQAGWIRACITKIEEAGHEYAVG